ncbi:ABC-three component system middle component 1 [Coraliomargarita sp. W4R53]
MKTIETLQNYIIKEAEENGWLVDKQQFVLNNTEQLQEEVRDHHIIESRLMMIERYPIILSELGNELNEAHEHWATAQKNAAIARTGKLASSGEDLLLILIGPIGSANNPEWQAFAMEVERNDLACRKLVWLPPVNDDDNVLQMQNLTRRTFISKRWLYDNSTPQAELDKLTEKNSTLIGWEEILDKQPLNRADVDYDQLVEQLIKNHK